MEDTFYICYYKSFIEHPVALGSTVFELLLTLTFIICGVYLNCNFLKKLEEQRRTTPIGRKGNVIEPIMRWFCMLQIIFWPYDLLFQWINANEIIPSRVIPPWLCYILWNTNTLGRSYIAYHSLFVALIRYLYIVHHQRSNQWNFKTVGKLFSFAYMVIPFTIWLIALFIHDPVWLHTREEYKNCVSFYTDSNTTAELPQSAPVKLAARYLPDTLIYSLDLFTMVTSSIAFLNIGEAYLYHRIFTAIKR